MELERVKYLLKSYLRTRLFKIERYLLYLVEKDQSSLLSEGEMSYAWSLYEGKKWHFGHVFLNKLPGRLNPFEAADSMEERLLTPPNGEEFVFVRFLRDYEAYMLNIEVEIAIKAHAVYFLPYCAVREFCERGEAELL
jgi:GINS complex subunit 4